MDEINEIEEMLKKQFKTKYLGKVNHYLGIEIQYDQKLENGIKLSQQKYIVTDVSM